MLTGWAIAHPVNYFAHPVNYCNLKILGKKKIKCINIYHDGAFDGAFASKLKIKRQFFFKNKGNFVKMRCN